MALTKDVAEAMVSIEGASIDLEMVANAMRNISGVILEYPPSKSMSEMCSTVMNAFADTIDSNRDRMMRSHDELRRVKKALS
jgi:hypothetical protein